MIVADLFGVAARTEAAGPVNSDTTDPAPADAAEGSTSFSDVFDEEEEAEADSAPASEDQSTSLQSLAAQSGPAQPLSAQPLPSQSLLSQPLPGPAQAPPDSATSPPWSADAPATAADPPSPAQLIAAADGQSDPGGATARRGTAEFSAEGADPSRASADEPAPDARAMPQTEMPQTEVQAASGDAEAVTPGALADDNSPPDQGRSAPAQPVKRATDLDERNPPSAQGQLTPAATAASEVGPSGAEDAVTDTAAVPNADQQILGQTSRQPAALAAVTVSDNATENASIPATPGAVAAQPRADAASGGADGAAAETTTAIAGDPPQAGSTAGEAADQDNAPPSQPTLSAPPSMAQTGLEAGALQGLFADMFAQGEQALRQMQGADLPSGIDAGIASDPAPDVFPGTATSASDSGAGTSASVTATASGIELQMSVEDMGALRMAFSQSDSGLHIAVSADNSQFLELLRNSSDLLAAELRQSGFTDSDITFDLWDGPAGQNGTASHDNGQEARATLSADEGRAEGTSPSSADDPGTAEQTSQPQFTLPPQIVGTQLNLRL